MPCNPPDYFPGSSIYSPCPLSQNIRQLKEDNADLRDELARLRLQLSTVCSRVGPHSSPTAPHSAPLHLFMLQPHVPSSFIVLTKAPPSSEAAKEMVNLLEKVGHISPFCMSARHIPRLPGQSTHTHHLPRLQVAQLEEELSASKTALYPPAWPAADQIPAAPSSTTKLKVGMCSCCSTPFLTHMHFPDGIALTVGAPSSHSMTALQNRLGY